MTYTDWEAKYFAWKKQEMGFLDQRMPVDDPQALINQKHDCDRLKAKARRQKARAEYYYRKAMAKKRVELIAGEGYSKSASRAVAKDECAREQWLRMETEALVDSLIDRSFAVDWEYKRIENGRVNP